MGAGLVLRFVGEDARDDGIQVVDGCWLPGRSHLGCAPGLGMVTGRHPQAVPDRDLPPARCDPQIADAGEEVNDRIVKSESSVIDEQPDGCGRPGLGDRIQQMHTVGRIRRPIALRENSSGVRNRDRVHL